MVEDKLVLLGMLCWGWMEAVACALFCARGRGATVCRRYGGASGSVVVSTAFLWSLRHLCRSEWAAGGEDPGCAPRCPASLCLPTAFLGSPSAPVRSEPPRAARTEEAGVKAGLKRLDELCVCVYPGGVGSFIAKR